ncbi:GerMN domain-containing protein [Streptomyces hyderabadensis]|uniref:GerMN domain-containing protein n=1 Tax=Streptomyces hyderabadensis TaxID=598549 RepID=A0ABP9HVR3_9ACTN|nr:GerMN domain-containing protein [Streptomyces hyderabadensis]
MKPSARAVPLLLAALLPLSACGIPETGVVEAGEPATGVLDPGVTSAPSESVPEAVPLVDVPLYFVEDGDLVAVDRTVPGPTDLGSTVLMLFKGPDERERRSGLTTELPPAAEAPTIRTDGTGVNVQLPRTAGSLSDTAVDQLACTVAVARLRQDPALGSAQVTVEQPGGRLAGRSSEDCPIGAATQRTPSAPGTAEGAENAGTGTSGGTTVGGTGG